VLLFPFLARLPVLKHYRGFEVPAEAPEFAALRRCVDGVAVAGFGIGAARRLGPSLSGKASARRWPAIFACRSYPIRVAFRSFISEFSARPSAKATQPDLEELVKHYAVFAL
jgi:hypothetical protein